VAWVTWLELEFIVDIDVGAGVFARRHVRTPAPGRAHARAGMHAHPGGHPRAGARERT